MKITLAFAIFTIACTGAPLAFPIRDGLVTSSQPAFTDELLARRSAFRGPLRPLVPPRSVNDHESKNHVVGDKGARSNSVEYNPPRALPSAGDINGVLSSVGIEAHEDRPNKVIDTTSRALSKEIKAAVSVHDNFTNCEFTHKRDVDPQNEAIGKVKIWRSSNKDSNHGSPLAARDDVKYAIDPKGPTHAQDSREESSTEEGNVYRRAPPPPKTKRHDTKHDVDKHQTDKRGIVCSPVGIVKIYAKRNV